MNNPPLGFIDANVLADAILAENLIQDIHTRIRNRKRAFQEIDDSLNSYPRSKHAYDLFRLLQQPPSPVDFVVTSNLALLEARHVIVEEYIKRKYAHRKTKVKVLQTDLAEIYIGITLFKRKIGHAMIVQDDFDQSLCEHLVSEYRCNARDAILVSTATRNSCQRFITRDNRLKKSLKDFNQIRLVQPETIANELRAFYKIRKPTQLRSTDVVLGLTARP